ncbi:hypothetical protein PCCS19_51390 [Paenibacillus sp. CCS19]|uniref:MBL fold metallo-hydrolase n=1 Tax=Paenibacillus sp. CCS19 TaxID=3158387 RepID=UPI0025683F83|nr:MBL fold metallo-hydrolase [Paenibacillus cellulosilyticus]GMK42080.1 hypothetical protein PCCS19_51390 [Paenibacillus cellulosilyticus]
MSKLNIQSFQLGPLQTNCYLLTDESGERGVIIDPGMGPKRLLERIESIHIEAILLTHAHFDHMGGVDEVRKAKGCPVYIHDLEAEWLVNAQLNGSMRWKDVTPPLTTDPAEYALDEGQTLELIGHKFSVMHTPGHSPGSISLLCGSDLFSGDVLFRSSIGRTDLPGGRERDLYDSIRLKLFKLPDDVTVYSGHGPKTTIGFEKANNPFVGLQR